MCRTLFVSCVLFGQQKVMCVHNKTIISFGFRMTARIIKASIGLCYPPQPLASGR